MKSIYILFLSFLIILTGSVFFETPSNPGSSGSFRLQSQQPDIMAKKIFLSAASDSVKFFNLNTTTNLHAVSVYQRSKIVIAGDNGFITMTTNRGKTWTQQKTPSTEHLYGIKFLNDMQILAVGGNSVIIKSTDKGITWINIPNPRSGSGISLRSIAYKNATNCVAVGDNGTILKSTDGGITWNDVSLSTSANLNCVYNTPGTNTYWIAGDAGSIYYSSNSGSKWHKSYTGIKTNLNGIIAIVSGKKSFRVAVGESSTILTMRGSQWVTTSTSNGVRYNGVDFPNRQIGYIVGDKGNILRYIKGTWSIIPTRTTSNLNAIDPPCEESDGIFCGDDGTAGIINPPPAFTVGDDFLNVIQDGNTIKINLNLQSHTNIELYKYKTLQVKLNNLDIISTPVTKPQSSTGRLSGWIIREGPPRCREFDTESSGPGPQIMVNAFYDEISFYIQSGSDAISFYVFDIDGTPFYCGEFQYYY